MEAIGGLDHHAVAIFHFPLCNLLITKFTHFLLTLLLDLFVIDGRPLLFLRVHECCIVHLLYFLLVRWHELLCATSAMRRRVNHVHILFLLHDLGLSRRWHLAIKLRAAHVEDRFEVLQFLFLRTAHLIVALLALALESACDDLDELAVAIALHLDALKRVPLHLSLTGDDLAARARVNGLPLAHCGRVTPGVASALLNLLVGVKTLLDLPRTDQAT